MLGRWRRDLERVKRRQAKQLLAKSRATATPSEVALGGSVPPVAGAGAIALARPEVRAGRALASLGRGVVIGAFPA